MNWIFPIILISIVIILLIITIKIEKFNDNFLDAVIYINLENRDDRKSLILKEIEKLDISNSKIHKISGVYTPKNGHKGCVQSHILALELAKLNKWQRVLILEDDAELVVEPSMAKEMINTCLNIPDWNIFMLGTFYKKIKGIVDELGNGLNVERVAVSTTGTAYIVKYDYIDTLMNVFRTSNDHMSRDNLSQKDAEPWALDQQWLKLQDADLWYCFNKDLFRQRNIRSTTQTGF
jgi:GR25 family glycosyltransferase involved in LPS biosynthesis